MCSHMLFIWARAWMGMVWEGHSLLAVPEDKAAQSLNEYPQKQCFSVR